MSQTSENYLGLALDEGSAFFVEESARSDSGVASISRVKLETFKYMGSSARFEYLMPEMTNTDFGMQAFENHVPDFRLQWAQFLTSANPRDAISKLDEFVRAGGGVTSAPCMRIIPGYALMQNAYRSAESLTNTMYGIYQYTGYYRLSSKELKIPPAMNERELKEIADGVVADVPKVITATDLIILNEMKRIVDAWRSTSITNPGIGTFKDDAKAIATGNPDVATSVLKRLDAFGVKPDWAEIELTIDDATGAILTVDKSKKVEQAFPHNTIKDGKSTPFFDTAVLAFNKGATSRGAKPEQVGADELSGLINGKRKSIPTVYLVDDNGTSVLDEVALQEYIADKPDCVAYKVTYERIPEYVIGVASDDVVPFFFETVGKAPRHRGIAKKRSSCIARARDFLRLRDQLAIIEMVAPAIRKRFAAAADALSDNDKLLRLKAVLGTGSDDLARGGVAEVPGVLTKLAEAMNELAPDMPTMKMDAPSVAESVSSKGYTIIATGRYAATDTKCVALCPIKGRGVAPILLERDGSKMVMKKPLDVAVVLEEPPATVISPIRAMIMTAALFRMFDYFNGKERAPGFNFEEYDPTNPTGAGQARPSPHALLNRQLIRYEQGLVQLIDNATIDQMPDIMRNIQRIIDAKIFLMRTGELLTSIIRRNDWRMMLQALFVSLLTTDGAVVKDSDGTVVSSVMAGVPPRVAAEFIFKEVMSDVVRTKAFREMAYDALKEPTKPCIGLEAQIQLNTMVEAEVLLSRARNGLELLLSLVDGSNELVPNIHAGSLQNMVDADQTLNIVQALKLALDRDYLGLVDKVEFEAPWETAEWASQFATFGVSVRHYPIPYEVADIAKETAINSGISSVGAALSRVGFDWKEIAPRCVRVTSSAEHKSTVVKSAYMLDQTEGKAFALLNNAPIAHQTVKVTKVLPSYDRDCYNMVKAYLTMNTSRTYFAQPVQKDVSDELVIMPEKVDSFLLYLAGAQDKEEAMNIWHDITKDGIRIERSPALADVALLVPYVSAYLTKPAISRDFPVVQTYDIDAATSQAVTNGVVLIPAESSADLLGVDNGIGVVTKTRTSISTALPWIGS